MNSSKNIQLSMFIDSDEALDILGRKNGLTDREKAFKNHCHDNAATQCCYKNNENQCRLHEILFNENIFSENRFIIDEKKCGTSCPYFLKNKE